MNGGDWFLVTRSVSEGRLDRVSLAHASGSQKNATSRDVQKRIGFVDRADPYPTLSLIRRLRGRRLGGAAGTMLAEYCDQMIQATDRATFAGGLAECE